MRAGQLDGLAVDVGDECIRSALIPLQPDYPESPCGSNMSLLMAIDEMSHKTLMENFGISHKVAETRQKFGLTLEAAGMVRPCGQAI
jgi:hypothetical protein